MKRSTTVSKWQKIGIIACWVMVWQLAYYLVGKDVLLPSPYQTICVLVKMMGQIDFYKHIIWTMERVLLGVGISLVAASVTSLFSYKWAFVRAFLKPAITLMKTTPVMAIIILALLWFKSGEVPVFVCFLMCYPIIYTNVLAGFNALDQELVEMTKLYKVPLSKAMPKCYIPQLRPYLYAALDLGVGMAFKVVIAAEVLAVPKYAVGYQLLDAKIYLETAEVFAWVIVIVFLSKACEWLINKLLKRGASYDYH